MLITSDSQTNKRRLGNDQNGHLISAAVTLELKKRAKQTRSVYIARTAVTWKPRSELFVCLARFFSYSVTAANVFSNQYKQTTPLNIYTWLRTSKVHYIISSKKVFPNVSMQCEKLAPEATRIFFVASSHASVSMQVTRHKFWKGWLNRDGLWSTCSKKVDRKHISASYCH